MPPLPSSSNSLKTKAARRFVSPCGQASNRPTTIGMLHIETAGEQDGTCLPSCRELIG